MQFVNLTPHVINVVRTDGSILSIPASGKVARCEEQRKLTNTHDGIEYFDVRYGNVYDLPEPEFEMVYIVSMAVRVAVPFRFDVVSPGELVRDDAGKPIGCKGFAVN